MKLTKLRLLALPILLLGMGLAEANYDLNMSPGVTEISEEVYRLHMIVIWICVVIGAMVFGAMFYSIYYHRKSRGFEAAQFHESVKVEMVWTIVPAIILVVIAIPATKATKDIYDINAKPVDMTIKVTGYQWRWRYEYLDEGLDFISSLDAKSNQARQAGSAIKPEDVDHYLLNVDRPLVVPINTRIRFLFTAADVIHSWWVPALGWKKDTIPGYINETWTDIKEPGTYRGQCAELCGRDHGFMPIVVVAKTKEKYAEWLAEQKAAVGEKAESAEKTWSKDELVAKGKAVYSSSCAGCHQPGGEGIPGTFPAITGGKIVTGDLEKHIEVVLNGVAAMPPFAGSLDAVDLAAVITYQRNALGNDVGDLVQPSDIQPRLADSSDDDDDDDDD